MNATALTASVIRLPSGRELSYCEFGDSAGIPVFGFHGTPGSRLQLVPNATTRVSDGYRLISPDRPGYDHSTYYAERRLTDWPGDVAALADHLGIDRFALFASPWSLSLGDIRIPVHFWQGGMDRNVPAAHMELMAAQVRGAVPHRYPDEGHFLVARRLDEVLAAITSG